MSPGFAHIRVASISGWVRVSFVLFFMIIHLLDFISINNLNLVGSSFTKLAPPTLLDDWSLNRIPCISLISDACLRKFV